MAEATVTDSLAIRARKLTALSRAKSDNEKETQDQTQLETALRKLNKEIGDLNTVLAVHRKLSEVGIPVQPAEGLDRPAMRLSEQVDGIGRPTAQFLTARSRDVTTASSHIADNNKASWRAWAERAVTELPLGLIPRLNPSQRQQVTSRVSELRKATTPPQLRSSDITFFISSLQLVRETLAAVGESNLDEVLAKFENGRVRLADLNEDELRMLREDGSLAEQLFLVLS